MKKNTLSQLKYTEAIAELEKILETMKDKNCDIDSLAAMTARAGELIGECRARLTKASTDLQDILDKMNK